MACSITINSKELRVKENTNLLWTALDNGVYIPNLCSIKSIPLPFASCRLCFVEIAGKDQPVTACTESVFDQMKVTLHSPKIRRLRKTSFDLLMSNHRLDCSHCNKNARCDLQRIAKSEHFQFNAHNFQKIDFDLPIDTSHPLFSLDRNKCILCGKCIWVCRKEGAGILDFAYRGIKTIVSTFADGPISETACISCLACVAICPVSALYFKLSKAKSKVAND